MIDIKYGGFWLRVIAFIIDTIITAVLTVIPGFVLGMVIGREMSSSGSSFAEIQSTAEAAGQVLGIFISWVYFASLEASSFQGTLGKRAVGLKVTDGQGDRISFARATGRYFAKIPSGLILFIGFLMIGWNRRKRGLHDIMAGTLVVKEAYAAPSVRLATVGDS